MKKLLILICGIFPITLSALDWNVSKGQPSMLHGEWGIMIEDTKLIIKFDRVGAPGIEKGRVNQLTLLAMKSGQQETLVQLKARVTEDITLPENWIYHLESPAAKKYAFILLRYSSDGEDPTLKPIFIITDGRSSEIRKYEFDEKFTDSGKADILALLSKISKEPVDQEMREAVNNLKINLN